MSKALSIVAMHRFGLGASARDVVASSSDPRQWLLGHVRGPVPPPPEGLPTARNHLARFRRARAVRDRKRRQRAIREARAAAGADMRRLLEASTQLGVTTPSPLLERLTRFWANHFAVSAGKSALGPAAAAFGFEALRPNILGPFSELLIAAVSHPAMLIYLDNIQSAGPHSEAARKLKFIVRREFDINENLAREILELHTLGVDGGYAQADVIALAQGLTGWSISGRLGPFWGGDPGRFLYRDVLHEPGTKTLLGKDYPQEGVAQARAMLTDLALHPSTANHLAFKLARHFVADDPDPALVAHLSAVYRETGGHLREVYEALLRSDAAWFTPLTKLKTPSEFVTTALRTIEVTGGELPDSKRLHRALQMMGQPPWQPPSPAGWPDIEAGWAGGAGLMNRLEFARWAGRRWSDRDPRELLRRGYGALATAQTTSVIERAASTAQGVALLLASPEFQRR